MSVQVITPELEEGELRIKLDVLQIPFATVTLGSGAVALIKAAPSYALAAVIVLVMVLDVVLLFWQLVDNPGASGEVPVQLKVPNRLEVIEKGDVRVFPPVLVIV